MKVLIGCVAGVAVAIAGVGVYAATYKPKARSTGELAIERTAERVERGRYLAEHGLGCIFCHTMRDETRRSMPAVGPKGGGGKCFTEEMGLPGTVCTPNLTPDPETGLGAWTDDEILRAMREGVSRDGRALFPMMPYEHYREVSDDDAHAVIAYLRSLEPVKNPVEQSKINFPVSFFIARLPQPIQEAVVSATPAAGLVEYGRHVSRIYGCKSCHGDDYAGGHEYPIPGGLVRTSNLTPAENGVVPADFEDFERMFRAYADGGLPEETGERDLTVMPWADLASLSDQDLRALHAFLRSLPPVDKQIQTYQAAAE